MTKEEFMHKYHDRIHYKFSNRNPLALYGISVDDGWMPLIEKCAEEIVAIDEDIRFFQIKEKFGGLRFYTDNGNKEKWEAIREVISKYERESVTVCEVCGEPGTIGKGSRMWIKTLCDKHRKEMRTEAPNY